MSSACFAHDFCVGEEVISNNGIYGQIVGIFGNGEISVKDSTMDNPISQDPSNLAVTQGHLDRYSVGDDVISNNGIYGKVVGIYESSGQVAVKYSTMDDPIAQNPSEIATTHGRSDRFRVGDQVISNNGIYGQVVGTYENGQVSVKYSTMDNPIAQDPTTLAATNGSAGAFKVGQDVLSTNGIYGKVVGIYENGQLAVKYSTMDDPIAQNTQDLAATNGCTDNCR